ncbi:MAG: hypothetical protein H6825_12725 [Planctomycetes bacterium]|nr:hypothetical protein [Planctomycetota bacterium]
MNDFLIFLKANKRWWLPPILIFFALLAWMAWKAANTPNDPFDYRGT